MQREPTFQLSTAGEDVCLTVADARWLVSVTGARRIGRDWFIQVLALGPRARTFTIRVATAPNEVAIVRRMLGLVSESLRIDDGRPHSYLDLTPGC